MVVASDEERQGEVSVVGTIVVADGKIVVRLEEKTNSSKGKTEGHYEKATIENLRDAARVLGAWLDLPYEDIALECQRVHLQDQQQAYFREMIDAVKKREGREK